MGSKSSKSLVTIVSYKNTRKYQHQHKFNDFIQFWPLEALQAEESKNICLKKIAVSIYTYICASSQCQTQPNMDSSTLSL